MNHTITLGEVRSFMHPKPVRASAPFDMAEVWHDSGNPQIYAVYPLKAGAVTVTFRYQDGTSGEFVVEVVDSRGESL